jgi:hypothetical protein
MGKVLVPSFQASHAPFQFFFERQNFGVSLHCHAQIIPDASQINCVSGFAQPIQRKGHSGCVFFWRGHLEGQIVIHRATWPAVIAAALCLPTLIALGLARRSAEHYQRSVKTLQDDFG